MLRHNDECAERLQFLIKVDGAESAFEGVSEVIVIGLDCQFEERNGCIFGE